MGLKSTRATTVYQQNLINRIESGQQTIVCIRNVLETLLGFGHCHAVVMVRGPTLIGMEHERLSTVFVVDHFW